MFTRSMRQRMMAKYYDRVQAKYDRYMAARKQEMLGKLGGCVVEIGPGTGANFAFLAPEIQWIGMEPNSFMHESLTAKATSHGIKADLRTASATHMDLADNTADVILSTLVLCSVPDLTAQIKEIRRVLKPAGKFIFIEHVAAPRGTWLRRWQRLCRPFWMFWADGCQPDREIAEAIQAAGFKDVDLEHFQIPRKVAARLVSLHIAGCAIKPLD